MKEEEGNLVCRNRAMAVTHPGQWKDQNKDGVSPRQGGLRGRRKAEPMFKARAHRTAGQGGS